MKSLNILKMILWAILFIIFFSCDSTEYCPLSHKINPEWKCRVCDNVEGKILIEHHNLDNGTILLSIYQNGRNKWIVHPYNKIQKFNNVLEKNTINFNPKNDSLLIVNGFDFKIEKYNQ